MRPDARVICGDALEVLRGMEAESVDCVVTSPPYFGLRCYGTEGQIGHEAHPQQYLERLWAVFDEAYRVLKITGVAWVNLGDTYGGDSPIRKSTAETFSASWNPAWSAGNGGQRRSAKRDGYLRPKQLLMIPARFAIGLCDREWILRNDITWHKPNAQLGPWHDRVSSTSERLFMFAKSRRYEYDTRLARQGDVWSIATEANPAGHPAAFPVELPQRCILASCPQGGIVLDPFAGSGTTGIAALETGRNFVGVDVSHVYCMAAEKRLDGMVQTALPLEVFDNAD